MYNEFDPKHYKGKWPCTTKTLYNEKTLIGRLHQYFLIYFETFSVPTADTLFLLILSILTLESAHSIRFLYQHFLSEITEKSLNVFYYACSYAKVDYSRFMNTTVRITLKLIPDSLQTQPVFLCVDDTMVSKFGTKFENVSKLFDHAAHNGLVLINISYCAMKILPYQNEHFSEYRTKSVQEFRFELSQGIRSQIFFATFVKNIETHIKSNAMTNALKQLIHQQVYHL